MSNRTGFGAKKSAGKKHKTGTAGGKAGGKKAKKSDDMNARIIQAAFRKYKVISGVKPPICGRGCEFRLMTNQRSVMNSNRNVCSFNHPRRDLLSDLRALPGYSASRSWCLQQEYKKQKH